MLEIESKHQNTEKQNQFTMPDVSKEESARSYNKYERSTNSEVQV